MMQGRLQRSGAGVGRGALTHLCGPHSEGGNLATQNGDKAAGLGLIGFDGDAKLAQVDEVAHIWPEMNEPGPLIMIVSPGGGFRVLEDPGIEESR